MPSTRFRPPSPLGNAWFTLLILLIGLSGSLPAHGQVRPLDYRVSTTVQGAIGGPTPFWQYAQSEGQLRPGSTINWLSGTALRHPFDGDTPFDVSAGVHTIGRLSDASNTAHIHELYGKAEYRGIRLSVGRFPDTIGMNWPDLSVGSMMVSRNAPPVPKIKVATPEFVDVPFTNRHLQIRGRWTDGRLGDDRVVPSPFLHQKALYVKVNVHRIDAIGGFVQNTIWGGEGQSQEIRDYLHLIVGSQAGTENDPNRVGNSVAAYDFALQYTSPEWTVRAYRLFYLEDSVSLRFRSPWDGMWGLGLRRTDGHRGWLNAVLYEHMNTIQQDALPGAPPGRASYYNHFIFGSGWTYKGTVLGNPLLTFAPDDEEVVNNMIIAHHLGIRGSPSPRLGYTVRATYSRNYGVCEDRVQSGTCHIVYNEPPPPDQSVRPRGEFRMDQYSVEGEIRYEVSRTHGLKVIASTAADIGSFYDDRWGLQVGMQWDGSLDAD